MFSVLQKVNRPPKSEDIFDNTFTLISLGCPKNRVDSERILYSMAQDGFVFTNDASQAHIVIVNTCAFIQTAVEESLEVILGLRIAAPHAFLVVAGCLPLRYRDELANALTEADIFITPSQNAHLPKIVKRYLAEPKHALSTTKQTLPWAPDAVSSPRLLHPVNESEEIGFKRGHAGSRVITTTGYAYLKIADGCNRSCRYCTIPKIRGPFKSAPFDNVVEESRQLAAMGVKEVILVAQDTVGYGRDMAMKDGLLKLVQAIAGIPDIQWIRLMYLHPQGLPRGLPQLISECDKLLPYLDIPFQHVSEKVLQAMGRPWKGDYIRKLIDILREKIPGLVLRTTFMVGFPGEGDREFQTLHDFIESYRIEHVGIFEYSAEEDTEAFALGDPVPSAVKKQRGDEIRKLNLQLAAARNRSRIGSEEKALVQGVSSESEYLLEGRLWDQAPEVDGVLYIIDGVANAGEIHDVLVTDSYQTDFFGVVQDR